MLSVNAVQSLTKYASRNKSEVDEYRRKPTKANKKKLIKVLKKEEEKNPLHIQGGYYKDTKTMLDRAEELSERGNVLRGVMTKYIGVPVTAITETILSPVRAVGRAISPDTNLVFSDIEDLKNLKDPEKVIRAVKELSRIYKEERPDPTANWEGIKKLVKSVNATPAEFTSDIVAQVASGGVPVAGDAVMDILSAPHTSLFNKLKWNGKSREEYIRKKKKKMTNKNYPRFVGDNFLFTTQTD